MSWQEYISKMGYRDDSPFVDEEALDIFTPNGMIDMSNTGRTLLANGRVLPPYSGLHQFDTNVVRETPIDTYGYLGLNRDEGAVGAGFGVNLPGGLGFQVSGNTPTRPNPYYYGGVGLTGSAKIGPWSLSGGLERNIKSGQMTPRFGAKYNFEEGGAVHAKAKILMDEGYDRDQAYAIAYSMQERGELPKAQNGSFNGNSYLYEDSLHNYNQYMELVAEAERLGLEKQEGKIGTGFEERDRKQKAYFDKTKTFTLSKNGQVQRNWRELRPSVPATDYSIYATPLSYMETMGNIFNTMTGGLADTRTDQRRWYIPEYEMPKGTRSISKMPFQSEPDPKIWKQDEPGNPSSIYRRIPEEVEETVTESVPTVDKKKEEKIKDSIQKVNPYGDKLFYIKYDSIGNSRHIPKHEYDLEVKKGELNVLESKQYGGSLPIAQEGIKTIDLPEFNVYAYSPKTYKKLPSSQKAFYDAYTTEQGDTRQSLPFITKEYATASLDNLYDNYVQREKNREEAGYDYREIISKNEFAGLIKKEEEAGTKMPEHFLLPSKYNVPITTADAIAREYDPAVYHQPADTSEYKVNKYGQFRAHAITARNAIYVPKPSQELDEDFNKGQRDYLKYLLAETAHLEDSRTRSLFSEYKGHYQSKREENERKLYTPEYPDHYEYQTHYSPNSAEKRIMEMYNVPKEYQHGGSLPIAQGGVELQDSTSAQRVKVRLDKAYKAAMDKYRLTNKPVVAKTIAPVAPIVPKPKRPAPKVVPPVQEVGIENLMAGMMEPQAPAYEPVWPKAEGIVGPTGAIGVPETVGVTGIEGPRYITIPKQPVEESIMDKIYDGLEALGNVEGVQDLIDLGKMAMEREAVIKPKSEESTLQIDIPVQKDLSSELTSPPVDADDAFLKTFRLASIQDKDITPIEGDGSGFIINFKPNTKVVFTPPASAAYKKGKNIENIRAMFFSNHAGKGTPMPNFGDSNEKMGEQSSSLNIIMGYNPKTQKMVFFNRAKKPKDYKDLNIPTQGGITWEELKKSISKNNNGEEIIETTEYPGYKQSTKIGGDLGMFAYGTGRSRKLSELTKTGTQDGGKCIIVYKKNGKMEWKGFWGGAKNLVDMSRKLEKSGATDITYIVGDAGSYNMGYVHSDDTYTPEEQRQVRNLNLKYPGAGSYLAIEPEYAKEAVGSYTKGGIERDTSFVIPPGVPHTFQQKRYGGSLPKAQTGTEMGNNVTLKMTPGDRTSPIYSDIGHTLVPQTEEGDPYVDLPEVVIEGLSPETEAFFDNPPSWYKYSEEFLDKKKKFLEQLDERKFYLNKDWMDLFGRGEREVINWEELNRIADKYRPDSPIGLPENYMTLGQDEDKYTNTMILQAWLQREKISKPFNQAYNEYVSKKLMEDNPRGNRDLDVWYNSFSPEQKPFLNSVGIGEEYGQNKWTEEGWSAEKAGDPRAPGGTIVDAAKTMLGYAGDALWTPSDLIGSAIDPQQSWYEGFVTNTGRFSSDPQKHAAAQLTTQIVTDPLMWVGVGLGPQIVRAAKATKEAAVLGTKLTGQAFKGVPAQTRRLARNISDYKNILKKGPERYRTPELPTPAEKKIIKEVRWIGKGLKENQTVLTASLEDLERAGYSQEKIVEASEKALKFLNAIDKKVKTISDSHFYELTNFRKKDLPGKIEEILNKSKGKKRRTNKEIRKREAGTEGDGTTIEDLLSPEAVTELRSILRGGKQGEREEIRRILGRTPEEQIEQLRYYRESINRGRASGEVTPGKLAETEVRADRLEEVLAQGIPRMKDEINSIRRASGHSDLEIRLTNEEAIALNRAAESQAHSPGRDFDVDQFNALSDPTDMQIIERMETMNPAERDAILTEYPHIAENARQVDELIAAHMAELRSTPSSRGRYATEDEMYAAMEGEGIRPEAFGSYGMNPTDPSYLAARIGGLDEVARIRSVHERNDLVRRAAEASRRSTPANKPGPESLPQTERTQARNAATRRPIGEEFQLIEDMVAEGNLTGEQTANLRSEYLEYLVHSRGRFNGTYESGNIRLSTRERDVADELGLVSEDIAAVERRIMENRGARTEEAQMAFTRASDEAQQAAAEQEFRRLEGIGEGEIRMARQEDVEAEVRKQAALSESERISYATDFHSHPNRGISGRLYEPDYANRLLSNQVRNTRGDTREYAIQYLADIGRNRREIIRDPHSGEVVSRRGGTNTFTDGQQELIDEFNIAWEEIDEARTLVREERRRDYNNLSRAAARTALTDNQRNRFIVEGYQDTWEQIGGSPRITRQVENVWNDDHAQALLNAQAREIYYNNLSRVGNRKTSRGKLLQPEGIIAQKIRKVNEMIEDPARTPLLTKTQRAQLAKENEAEILKFAQPTERSNDYLIDALFAGEGVNTEGALVRASHKIDNATKGTIFQASGSLSADSWEGGGRMFNTKLEHGKVDVGYQGYQDISGAGFSNSILPKELQLKGLNQVITNINKNLPAGKKIPYGYIEGKYIKVPNLTAIRKKYGGSLPIAQEGLNDNPYFGGTIPPVTIYSDPGDLEAYENKIRNLNLSNLYKLPMELGSKFSDIGKTMFVDPAVRLYDKGATQVAKDFGSTAADAAALQWLPYTKINPLTGTPYGEGLETILDASTYLGLGVGALAKNTARKVVPKLIPKLIPKLTPKGVSPSGITPKSESDAYLEKVLNNYFKEKGSVGSPISPKVIDKHMNHLFGKENIDITKQKLKELGVDDIDHFKKWLKDDAVYFMGKRNRAGNFPKDQLPLKHQKKDFTPGIEFTSDPNVRPPGLSEDVVLDHEFGHLIQTYLNKHGRVPKLNPEFEKFVYKQTGRKPDDALRRRIEGDNTQLDRDAVEFVFKGMKNYNRLPQRAKQNLDYASMGNTRRELINIAKARSLKREAYMEKGRFEKEVMEEAALMREYATKNNMEPLPHLREMRAGLLESGVIKSFQEPINVSKLRKYKNTLQGENDRMLSFLKNDYTTMKELKDLLNRTPIVVGTVGAGTVLNEKYQYGGESSKEEGAGIDLENLTIEDALSIYRSYIEGTYDETENEVLAEQVYDKLNRLYYKEAKEQGMSVANYIMSNIKG